MYFLGFDIETELKLDLTRVTIEPEVFCAVPRSTEQIDDLVEKVVELFWERRRYGESWQNMNPPASYYISPRVSGRSDVSSDNTNSSDVYKRMVFEMTSELLRDMYRSECEEQLSEQHCTPSQYVVKHPPTTLDTLKPMVQRQIKKLLRTSGGDEKTIVKHKPRKWSSRKRKDNVDLLLVDELKSEEPNWVNYDVDELTVKTLLADAIFDSLLVETGRLCLDVFNTKR